MSGAKQCFANLWQTTLFDSRPGDSVKLHNFSKTLTKIVDDKLANDFFEICSIFLFSESLYTPLFVSRKRRLMCEKAPLAWAELSSRRLWGSQRQVMTMLYDQSQHRNSGRRRIAESQKYKLKSLTLDFFIGVVEVPIFLCLEWISSERRTKNEKENVISVYAYCSSTGWKKQFVRINNKLQVSCKLRRTQPTELYCHVFALNRIAHTSAQVISLHLGYAVKSMSKPLFVRGVYL